MSALVSTNFDEIEMIRPGSIVGLGTELTAAVTEGTLTVIVTKNGTTLPFVLIHTAASNPLGGQATQPAGIDTYVAGDKLGMQFQTVGFSPSNDDIEGWLEVQE